MGVFVGELSFKKMSAGGRLCTLQENPHFWVPTIKVRPPDGTSRNFAQIFQENFFGTEVTSEAFVNVVKQNV
jgi:hypothetical protein